jgi:hypothetical protein
MVQVRTHYERAVETPDPATASIAGVPLQVVLNSRVNA